MNFICPVCGLPLDENDGGFACKKGHIFDKAKSGYVNLLLCSGGGNHGDNKLMLSARRDFLGKGYYEPFANALSETVRKYARSDAVIVDCGCGEGYYTEKVKGTVPSAEVIGFDISKQGVLYASKRNCGAKLCVASSFNIPLSGCSADMILEIFSPYAEAEFKRILKKGGYMIMGIPLENHLYSLKKAVYDKPYKNKPHGFNIDGFALAEKREIKFKTEIENGTDIKNLFMMTPYYYKTGRDEQKRLEGLQSITLDAEFALLVYKKI